MPTSHVPLVASALVLALLGGATTAQFEAFIYTPEDRLRTTRGAWVRPERVERLEIAGATAPLEAWVGKQVWPLTTDPHKPVAALVMNAKIRAAWRAGATLHVGYATQRDSGGEIALRASPDRLTLPDAGVEFTIIQRARAKVEGSDGYLEVTVGDITDAQTLLTVHGADGKEFVAQKSVRQGDQVVLDFGAARYVLLVKQIKNLLIGDDFAVFRLVAAERFEVDRIERLLRRIEVADVVFVREGTDYDAKAAVAHLRRKLAAVDGPAPTLEAFIKEVGSHSSTTGKAYSIRTKDGTTLDAEAWLRTQAAELDRPEPRAPSADRR